jgi:23S rRNA (cytidine1920-2'-O)/16S rRNA (cytidine1409-2'-O)-methyltransferase
LAPDEKRARALIMAGNVLVAENVVDKAGATVRLDAAVRLKRTDCPYVSRGGLKLKAALEHFQIDVRGLVALDVGASTGGFTDCLLQAGAARVYALDVGYGQLAWKLREDKRVVLIERTNVRHFSGAGLAEKADLATIDASFISLRLVIPAVLNLIAADASLLALIKPQFEVERKELGACGVVEDEALHHRVIEEITSFCGENHLEVVGVCASPLTGPAGNREFFIYSRKRGEER